MNKTHFISAISIFLLSCFPAIILSQQPYVRQAASSCDAKDSDNSTSVLGYTCNGPRRRSCQSYLTFRSTPPYTSLSAVSTLFSVNSSQLAQLNSVVPEANTVFEANRVILIPVTCSCTGQHYQVNASYVVRQDDTYLGIANTTFQGLSTCQSLLAQNGDPTQYLYPGTRVTVPLRCACPTQDQSDDGVNYLLSYLVTWNQFVSAISALFGVDTGKTLAANGLSETDFNIYPFTTLLVPLQVPPTSSQVTAPQPPPPPSSTTATVPPPASGGSSSKSWVFAVVGAVGGIVLASIVGAIIFFVFFRQKKRKTEPVVSSQSFESVEKPLRNNEGFDDDDNSQLSQDFLESISSIAQSLKVYPFQELKTATQDFNPSSRIKGSVYLGTINGDSAAIKKMNGGDVTKEINLLNKINHFNLIRLSGVSFNEGQWYLVYEYASNGQLSDWIHRRSEDHQRISIMNWNKRLQIAFDIAAGLNYLHRYTSPPHIHKDLNSSNILLDENFRAKIANFGLSRSAEGQEGHFALTRHIIGTKGYMAPEYLENGIVSTKMDVYSFGVVMLEILTGKEVPFFDMEPSEVLTQVLSEDDGGIHENLRKLMDPVLQEKYPKGLALVLFKLIHRCLEKAPSDRPEMDDVFQSLSRISTSTLSGEWAISISENLTVPR